LAKGEAEEVASAEDALVEREAVVVRHLVSASIADSVMLQIDLVAVRMRALRMLQRIRMVGQTQG
jgi:hypothetical protein